MSVSRSLAFICMCFLSTASAKRVQTVVKHETLQQSSGSCVSATQKRFAEIKARGYVAISNAGVVTLPKVKTIPFEGIKTPSQELPKLGKAGAKYTPVMKKSADVTNTLDDLKALIDIVGIEAMTVEGKTGGKAYSPGGSHHNEAWKAGWIKVAKSRAESIIKELGVTGRTQATGSFGVNIGVDISITAKLNIASLNTSPGDPDCTGRQEVRSADAMVAGVKEVLARGRIGLSGESINFLNPKFIENVIPFVPCATTRSNRGEGLVKCIPKVDLANDNNQKQDAHDAMNDLSDLAAIADVTKLEVVGFTASKPAAPDEQAAAMRLGAARARLLVDLLLDVSSSDRMTSFASQVNAALTACVDSTTVPKAFAACGPVSKFGKMAVEIRMATLVNPAALA